MRSVLGCAVLPLVLGFSAECRSEGVTQPDPRAHLYRIFERFWEEEMREDPLLATSFGIHSYDDRLRETGLEALRRRATFAYELQKELDSIDRAALSRADGIHLEVLYGELSNRVEEFRFVTHLAPITQRSGPQIWIPQLASRVPLEGGDHFKNFIARMRAVPAVIDGEIEAMRKGLELGYVPPRITLEGVLEQIDSQLVENPRQSLLFEPFRSLPPSIPAETRARLQEKAEEAIGEAVVPAFRRLREFLRREYLPSLRSSIAISDLPHGEVLYRFLVRRFTTTHLSPEEIHQIGLGEVARLRAEMERVKEESGFEGDLAAFIEFLRSDPRFYHESPEALLRGYRDICKRMDAALPQLFGRLPRIPYGVRAIPDFEAPRTTTAYYRRAAADGSRPGWFYANTFDLKSRPIYEMEALALHEAVPGHHLQIALQMEMTGVPQFRRLVSYTAFTEGWGLYAESLGKGVGFYEDPYSEFGRLSYEMWRALRLVVDTGIHLFGWSRERAIELMLANSALTRANVEAEVDRYISWPAQALAYKIGQLKILELRRKAERELGEGFDLRAFHDALLEDGAIPLGLLEEKMEAFIAAAKGSGAAGAAE